MHLPYPDRQAVTSGLHAPYLVPKSAKSTQLCLHSAAVLPSKNWLGLAVAHVKVCQPSSLAMAPAAASAIASSLWKLGCPQSPCEKPDWFNKCAFWPFAVALPTTHCAGSRYPNVIGPTPTKTCVEGP